MHELHCHFVFYGRVGISLTSGWGEPVDLHSRTETLQKDTYSFIWDGLQIQFTEETTQEL